MSLEGAPSMKYVMHYTGNTVTVTADIRIYNVVEQVLNGAQLVDKYFQKYATCLQRCKAKYAKEYRQFALE